jgi:hypothetical protein
MRQTCLKHLWLICAVYMFLAAFPLPVLSAPCTTGTLDHVLGTSCSIGNILFSFATGGVNFSIQDNGNNAITGLSASTIMFTVDNSDPSRPGFSLTGNFGVSPLNSSTLSADQSVVLGFSISPLSSGTITRIDLSLADVSLSSSTFASVFSNLELCPTVSAVSCGFIGLERTLSNGVLVKNVQSGSAALPSSTSGSYSGITEIGTSSEGTPSGASVRSWNFHVISGSGCRVANFTQFGQYDAKALSSTLRYQALTQYPPPTPGFAVPQYFGFLPTPDSIPGGQSNPYVVCPTIVSGCALTSAASMLTAFGSLAFLDPTQLDSQLKQNPFYGNNGTISLCPVNMPSCSTSQPDDRISYPDWCEFPWQNLKFAYPNVIALDSSGQTANSQLYDANQGTFVPVDQYLNDNVCANHDRVILQLDETTTAARGTISHAGSHYVFVTGQSGSDWTLFDPGWSSANPSGSLSSLQAHLTGFQTSDGTFRVFSVSGARAYKDISSTGNRGGLSVTANSPVELLLLDPQNRSLGSANGQDIFDVPQGSYMREYPLADDTGSGTANGDPTGIKTAYIEAPLSGLYRVTATGTGLGTYTLTFRALATDGTLQTGTVVGVTNLGATSTYQVGYSPLPGGSGPLSLITTFGSTLADIRNSLALGFIDDEGIANSLLSKINAASAAHAQGETKRVSGILDAFINEVNAQTSKHINGIAPQVLLSDARSLLREVQGL